MRKKTTSIPVNYFGDGHDPGISIERLVINNLHSLDGSDESHRHDRHSFFLLESGIVYIEIDFQKYKIKAPSVIYIHPNQVHNTTAFEKITVSNWAINNENLNAEYLALLEGITPAKPLLLNKDMFSIMSEALTLCLKFSERKHDRLHHSLLKDSCNALVALVLSQYLERSKPADKFSRFETVTKSFRALLEHDYATVKSPAAYAGKLNISTHYLNECVKGTTGHPVSYHIQQRVVLEAKRLLYHSGRSVKEIASELGYDDYPYFSRLFTKVTGMTALAFRNKNAD